MREIKFELGEITDDVIIYVDKYIKLLMSNVKYSFLEKYDGSLAHLKEEALSLTPSQTAFHIAQALDFTDSCEDIGEYDPQLFLEQVLSQAYPEHTKLCIMDCYARHHKLMEEACDFILPVLKAVTTVKTSLISMTDLLTKDVSHAVKPS